MVWYDPRTWGKKESEPTTTTQPAGTYLTSSGLQSIDPSKVEGTVTGVYVGPSPTVSGGGTITTTPSIAPAVEEEVVVEEQQYETFKEAGYTPAEAAKLASWSVKEKMTPSYEKAREILRGVEKKEVLARERVVREFGAEPKFVSPFAQFYTPVKEEVKEKIIPPVSPEVAYRRHVEETPFRELELPAQVLKVFHITGEGVVEFVSDIQPRAIFGETKVGEIIWGKPRPIPEEGVKILGPMVGEMAMWGFFSPVFATGAAGVTQKTITLEESLSKSRFGKDLEKALSGKAAIETKVAKMKTQKEQIAYLKAIKAKITDPFAKKGFERFAGELLQKQVIKPYKVIITKEGQVLVPRVDVSKKDLIVYVAERVPKMKFISMPPPTTLTTELTKPKPLELEAEEEVIRVSEREVIASVSGMVTSQKLIAPQVIKDVAGQISAPRTILRTIPRMAPRTITEFKPRFPSPTISMKPTKPEKAMPFFPRIIRLRRLESEKKIVKVKKMIVPTKYRPSLVAVVREIKAPRIPKGYFKGMGSLIIRPIITVSRKKRKKK